MSDVLTIDRQLFELHNRQSWLEYLQDTGHDVEPEIDDVREQVRALVLSAETARAIEDARSASDPIIVRMGELLDRERRFSAVDDEPAVRRARAAIQGAMADCSDEYARIASALATDPSLDARRQAMLDLAQLNSRVEPACREWIEAANRAAVRGGYADYAQAKLAHEDLDVDVLTSLFASWRRELAAQYRAALSSASETLGRPIEAADLIFLLGRHRARLAELVGHADPATLPAAVLAGFGERLEELPITIEFRDLPFSGAGYRIKPGHDVRIVVNADLKGMSGCYYLLHELGHAAYYTWCPRDTQLLIDDHPYREIMADVWAMMAEEVALWERLLGIGRSQASEAIRLYRETKVLRLYLHMREALFTAAVVTRPDEPLAAIWWSLTRDVLGVDDPSGSFEYYDFQHPLDMKNYVLSQVLAERVYDGLPKSDGSCYLRVLIDRYYTPGNAVPWRYKLGLTGP